MLYCAVFHEVLLVKTMVDKYKCLSCHDGGFPNGKKSACALKYFANILASTEQDNDS